MDNSYHKLNYNKIDPFSMMYRAKAMSTIHVRLLSISFLHFNKMSNDEFRMSMTSLKK